jgi:uncharacterized protein YhaN
MNLERCHITGFGKLTEISVSFGAGLNVVHAQNEGGKSTLQRCLVGLLYGQWRPDLKTQRRLDVWVEQYKPWYASQYAGILWCRLADGREFEIDRKFGKEDSRVIIRSALGEDVTRTYEQQRNGEVLFARSHLDLPKELFESVAMIRETQLSELNSSATIRDRIANLAQFGDEELSVGQSLGSLQEALTAIGTDRAPTKPLKQAMDRLDSLRTEAQELEARRQEYEEWVKERNRLAAKVADLEQEMEAAQRGVLLARQRETAERVRVLEEIESEMHNLGREIASLGADPGFPAQDSEELEQLVGAIETTTRRLEKLRNEIESSSLDLQKREAERSAMQGYADLSSTHDADGITESFVSYLALSSQRNIYQRSLLQLQEEIDRLQSDLKCLPLPLRNPSVDWPRKIMDASERERENSQKCIALAEQLSKARTRLAKIRRQRFARQGVATALLMAALISIPGALLRGPEWPSAGSILACGLVCLAAGALFSLLALRARKIEQEQASASAESEAEQMQIRADTENLYSEIRPAMAEAGHRTIEGFLTQAELAGRYRQKLGDLGERLQETEQQHEKASADCTIHYEKLKECLSRIGVRCSPASLRVQVDELRAGLRRYRELDASLQNLRQLLESARSQEQESAQDLDNKQDRLKTILSSAGVSSPEAFRQGCESKRRLLELRAKEAACKRDFDRHRENRTLDQWRERLRSLESQAPAADGVLGNATTISTAHAAIASKSPLLPYLPSVEEAESVAKAIAENLAKARQNHTGMSERVRQAFHKYRTFSEIEEDLALAEAEARRLETNRRALETAVEIFRGLAREQQEVLAPQLNRAVEARFLRLSRGHYQEVKIDPDFKVLARDAVSSQLRPAGALSRGTQDQLYLALRFGILDLLASPIEPCPCLLDEPFAAYDHIRMDEAFGVLEEECRRRQLILFTCREDILELALRRGADVVQLKIADVPA